MCRPSGLGDSYRSGIVTWCGRTKMMMLAPRVALSMSGSATTFVGSLMPGMYLTFSCCATRLVLVRRCGGGGKGVEEVVEVGEAERGGQKSRGPSESNPNRGKRPSRAPLCRFLSVFPWDGAYRPSQAHKTWVCVEWESRQSRRRRVCQGACLGVDDVRELLALVHLLECPHPNLRDRRRCEILAALQSA